MIWIKTSPLKESQMKNLKDEKLYIQVFREIRSYIIRHDLKAGDQIPTEQAMCEMLGVSRNVLREAIKSMELMGMVRACPGRGTIVQEFNLDFVFQNVMFASVGDDATAIREMLVIRKKIELGYMREAYTALTEDDIRRIRGILEEIKHKWDKQIFFHADDKDFHMSLFSHLNNRTLSSLLDAIWAVDENFKKDEKVKFMGDTVQKHENIVRALEQHNEEAFEAAMLAHFSSGKYSTTNSFEE